MERDKKAIPKRDEPEAVPNHSEKIKSQVLAKIGKPPRLDHVEVSRHHNGHYRVNIGNSPSRIRVSPSRLLLALGGPII